MVVKFVPVVVVGVLVLAGCSGNGATVANTSSVPAPSPSASVSTSASASASAPLAIPTTGPNVLPGAHVPVMPAQAREHTAAGATFFAANIGPALDWAYSTTNASILRQYYAPDCESCKRSLQKFDSVAASGQTFVGGHIKVSRISLKPAVPAGEKGEFAVDVTLTEGALKVLDRSGAVVHEEPGTYVQTIQYSMSWLVDEWKIVESIHLSDSQ